MILTGIEFGNELIVLPDGYSNIKLPDGIASAEISTVLSYNFTAGTFTITSRVSVGFSVSAVSSIVIAKSGKYATKLPKLPKPAS